MDNKGKNMILLKEKGSKLWLNRRRTSKSDGFKDKKMELYLSQWMEN